jgi:type IV secretory pathway TraG/TraD family ATPase VirD4
VKNTLGESSGDNIFWNTQTISLLSLLISLLKKQEPRFCNMANLKYLVDNFKSNPDLCDSLVAQSGDEDIIREYKNFISYEPRVLNNIISSCRSSLILFGDPNIQKITSFDSIGDFDNLRREKKAIYIQNKTAEMAYFAPLSSLLLEQAFASIMDRIPSPTEKTIFILIDEASALVTPTLQVGLSNFRKFQCSVVLGYQDYNQVIHSYGRNNAEAIKANCFMRIYFGNQPIETCREIESMLGKFEVEDENGRYKVKNLMEASDIRSIPTNTALVFLGSKSAVFAKLTPFFEQKKLLKYSQMALPERTIQIPSTIEWVKSA